MGLAMPYPPQNYNPQFDADRIRKATKGFGTDEKAMIAVLAPLTAPQMHVLGKSFEAQVGRTLIDVVEKETKGDFEFALRGLVLGPLGWDLWLMDRACKGFGTHEDLLTELLMTRTNLEIHTLKQAYKALLGSDVTNLVKGELSSKTERIFLMALAGQRDESGFINQQQVTNDVNDLYKGGAGRMGTDEIKLASVLITRSPPHLAAVSREYHSKHGKSLSQAIDSEFGGHMKDALLYIAEAAERDGQGVDRDAIMIERAMAGMGTKDERLTWRIIRGHWDKPRWAAVKAAYQRMYGKSMASRVKGETTGDLENILVAVIG
ncbi:hypothetical protein BDY24DRAFT_426420 [Mrakia frigida]|uniref:annexin n=1 Tax=Mrakia frigida TaxID=29902 RepID=UPI003FCBF0C4